MFAQSIIYTIRADAIVSVQLEPTDRKLNVWLAIQLVLPVTVYTSAHPALKNFLHLNTCSRMDHALPHAHKKPSK